MKALRHIFATILGMLAGSLTVGIIEFISSLMHPMPEGLNLNDQEAMTAWISQLPMAAFLMLAIAWTSGTFVASTVAKLLTPNRASLPALIAVTLLLLATVGNLIAFPHPLWLWPLGILGCMLGGLLGIVITTPKRFTVVIERSINAPVETVFATVANGEQYSEAVPGIVNVEILSETKQGVGTRFRETRVINGRTAASVMEITEIEEHKLVRFLSEAGGARWDSLFLMEQSSNLTHLRLTMQVTALNFAGRLFTPMFLGMVEKAVGDDMDAVKKYCER